MRHALTVLGLTLLVVPPALAAEPDWGEILRRDAEAVHKIYADSHPGPVDAEHPAFKLQLEGGLARALERAPQARSFGGYWWAMREYLAGFDDGHVQITTTAKAPKLALMWPGFLTRYQAGQHLVAARLDGPETPPIGARLVSCDGVAADRLATDRVGRFRGRWMLESQRESHAWRLFLEADNPYARRPSSCVFESARGAAAYALTWRATTEAALAPFFERAQAAVRAPIESRAFGDGGLWISFGSFDGDPGSEQGRALEALFAGLESDSRPVTTAKTIVLDVRGNSGGSSHWGVRTAELLWGARNTRRAAPGNGFVEWRVSDANIAAMSKFHDDLTASPNPDPARLGWANTIVSGLKRAKSQGRPLWRQGSAGRSVGVPPPLIEPPRTAARVYILADGACISACLDALDIWRRLGAVQVGRETSADTVYMEVRGQELPSGLASIIVPMKVYRGRARGSNVPYRPEVLYEADMRDTGALEAWIGALAARPAETGAQRAP